MQTTQPARRALNLATRAVLAATLAAGLCGHAAAQTYPTRPIKIIIPSAAGGPGDLVVRTVSAKMSALLGQPIVAENRAGAAGTIGVGAVAKAAPDGYTLLLVSSTHAATESLYPNRGYVLTRDLAGVSPLSLTPSVLAVHPSVAANNVQEFVALAKSQPGKITYASGGVGNIFHLTAELFSRATDVRMTHVPYSQSNVARADLAAGQVQVMFDAISSIQPLTQSGKVRVLATTGARRSAVMPNVPTVAESGYPTFQADTWTGILAPAGTPEPVLEKLHAAIQAALQDKDVVAAFAQQGSEAIVENRAQFGTRVQQSVEQWSRLIREAGIKAE